MAQLDNAAAQNGGGKLPNTFLIGAPKSGTTALAAYLSTHPNIFIAWPKEPKYWSSDIREAENYGLNSHDDYLRLFDRALPRHKVGIDASTNYLWSRTAISAILEYFHGARFIIMLRNPVEIAYAYHMENCYWLAEDIRSFEEAWMACEDRREGRRIPMRCADAQNLDYERIASIGTQLNLAKKQIPSRQLLVLFLEDLAADPSSVYQEVISFLGLPDDGRTDFPRLNSAKAVTRPGLSQYLLHPPEPIVPLINFARKCLWRMNVVGLRSRVYDRLNSKQKREPLRGAFRDLLAERFRSEIEMVQALTARDLSHWLERSS